MKLTKAQRRLLIAANEGGVLAFGPTRQTQDILKRLGYLTPNRDATGYYNITDAGRAALEKP